VGHYTVTESDPGPNFTLAGLSCTTINGSVITTNTGTRTADIVLNATDVVECTYTNSLQLGAIRITKRSTKGGPLAGATFAVGVKGSTGAPIKTLTSGSDGTACIDGLLFGDYTVTETGAPGGYSIDNKNAVTVTVDHVASCTAGTPNAPPDFTDTPLSKLVCAFESLPAGNPTSATIQCTGDGSSQALPEGTTKVLDNLAPGTYTCTVVIK
jgi:hypothetical protein